MTTTHPGSARTSLREWATGVTVFAAVMLMIGGILDVMRGIAEIADDDIFVSTRNYVFEFNLTAWGWIHLVIGLIGIATAIGILMGQTWGRVAGIVVAFLSALANFAFVPYYPVWSLLIIAFSGLVIWALCTQLSNESTT